MGEKLAGSEFRIDWKCSEDFVSGKITILRAPIALFGNQKLLRFALFADV